MSMPRSGEIRLPLQGKQDYHGRLMFERVSWSIAVVVALGLPVVMADEVGAESGHGCAIDDIQFSEVPGLDRAERIRRMDEAYYEALERFELCLSDGGDEPSSAEAGAADGKEGGVQGRASAQGATASGRDATPHEMASEAASMQLPDADGAVSEVSQSQATTVRHYDSVPSGAFSGTDVVSSLPSSSVPMVAGTDAAASPREASASLVLPGPSGPGQRPEDIVDVDNESILAKQIRAAAERETDAEQRKHLWNEYRKYQGLPPVQP